MALFTGTYDNKLDRKCRISLPVAFRYALNEAFSNMSTIQQAVGDGSKQEECEYAIYLYPSPQKSKMIEGCDVQFMSELGVRLKKLPRFSRERTLLTESYIARAERVVLDGQGRFLLPKHLKQYGDITEHCTFMGLGDHFTMGAHNPFKASPPALDQEALHAAWRILEKEGAS